MPPISSWLPRCEPPAEREASRRIIKGDVGLCQLADLAVSLPPTPTFHTLSVPMSDSFLPKEQTVPDPVLVDPFMSDGACSMLAVPFHQSLILVVGTNPDPDVVSAILHGDGAVVGPHPCKP